MNNNPGVHEVVRWLEEAERCLRTLAERELESAQVLRKGADADRARTHAAAAAEYSRRGQDLEAAGAEHARRLAVAAARHRGRTNRIRGALRKVRKQALERVEADEGRRKFALQRELLRATRDRDAALAAADEAMARGQSEHAERHRVLESLELRARDLLSVVGSGAARLVTVPDESHPSAGGTEGADAAVWSAADRALRESEAALEELRRNFWRRLLSLWPVGLLLVLLPLPLIPVLHAFGVQAFGYGEAGMASAVVVVLGVVLHFLGRARSRPVAERAGRSLHASREHLELGQQRVLQAHAAARAQAEEDLSAREAHSNREWAELREWAESERVRVTGNEEARANALLERLENARTLEVARAEAWLARAREEGERVSAQRLGEFERAQAERAAGLRAAQEDACGRARAACERLLRELDVRLAGLESNPAARVPAWGDPAWDAWEPPREWPWAVRLGEVRVRLTAPEGADDRVGVGGGVDMPERLLRPFEVPLLLAFPKEGNLVLEAPPSARPRALGVLNQVVLRLLAGAPAGRVGFTLVDPVGMGESFAGLMHLADRAEHVLRGRIWTQPGHLEERLAELNDHIERVIQMYLRNEFPTIAEYNARAGAVAERLQFLVIMDFPAGFTEVALRRLESVIANGPRCGVYTLLHWDPQRLLPPEFKPDVYRRGAVRFLVGPDTVLLEGRTMIGMEPRLDPPPDAARARSLVHAVARASADANRVEVPFDQVAPAEAEVWSASTAEELRVAIGRTGATKLQYLALGRGTRQHVLVAGKTGSGKSTLFHVMVTNLALWCSPEEVEFYLVDFKKGVEFKPYATHRLPHARVVAIESDRDFGVSVLHRVDEELRRRGDLFRTRGVQDLPGWRRAAPGEPMPRVLLLVDEFQEFFVEEDRLAQMAAVLLDRIVRQGRAFGIHVVLGSQTLGGAYSMARSTLGQMVVRIALMSNEADALLIMDEDNPAPRLLSRPGEGIYNDSAGAREANSPFQTVWIPDEVRSAALARVRARADADRIARPGPVVFEGDAPADVRENAALEEVLAAAEAGWFPSAPPRCWLGSPNAIEGPVEVVFERRGGHHLLLVGQRDEAIATLLGLAVVSLSAQFPPGGVRFRVLDGSGPDSPQGRLLAGLVATAAREVIWGGPSEAAEMLKGARDAAGSGVTEFVVVHGIQHFPALRQEDEFAFSPDADSPASVLKALVAEGAGAGVHLLVSCDGYNDVLRFLGRKSLGEFGMRVLFQMSANDSASLVDSPEANRLGLQRALFHRQREGRSRVFRPYAPPDGAWREAAARRLGGGLARQGA